MIRCIKFRRYEKNTLRGYADLELTRVGLVLRDCTWHVKGDKEWVSFAARPYETADGTTGWAPLIEFAEGATEARKQFQQQALEAIHRAVVQSREETTS
jgi:hypothetical protein